MWEMFIFFLLWFLCSTLVQVQSIARQLWHVPEGQPKVWMWLVCPRQEVFPQAGMYQWGKSSSGIAAFWKWRVDVCLHWKQPLLPPQDHQGKRIVCLCMCMSACGCKGTKSHSFFFNQTAKCVPKSYEIEKRCWTFLFSYFCLLCICNTAYTCMLFDINNCTVLPTCCGILTSTMVSNSFLSITHDFYCFQNDQ